MLRPRIRVPRIPRVGAALQAPRRTMIYAPKLQNIDPRVGIPNFIGPGAFDMAWTQQMNMLITGLNLRTEGSDLAELTPKEILLRTARDPERASIFNYASMAHNTEFFFRALAPHETRMPEQLAGRLTESFGSIETLKQELIATAMGMFGPGFVWLVRTDIMGNPNTFRILPTYLAGSPYPGAHWRQQAADMNTAGAPLQPQRDENGLEVKVYPPPGTAQGYLDQAAEASSGRTPAKAQHTWGGINVTPVLCVSTWEHVWLPDHGLFVQGVSGKLNYLYKWWDRIDWNKVSENSHDNRPNQFKS